MSSVKIIKKQEELNEIACDLLLCANESKLIRLTSAEMRWLSIRKDNSNDYYTLKQKEACKFFDTIVENYGSQDWAKLNMRILLYKDPVKKQNNHIKKLIKCGADIRYLPENNTTKIILLDNKLFLSFALTFDKVVNTGILYTGCVYEDPLIDHYVKFFDNNFFKARKLILNKNEELRFTEGWFKTAIKCIRDYKLSDWIKLILGALLGLIISGIFSSFMDFF